MKTLESFDKPTVNYLNNVERRDVSKLGKKNNQSLESGKDNLKTAKEKPDILFKLVTKYDFCPPTVATPKYEKGQKPFKKEKPEKKNIISMTRISST